MIMTHTKKHTLSYRIKHNYVTLNMPMNI